MHSRPRWRAWKKLRQRASDAARRSGRAYAASRFDQVERAGQKLPREVRVRARRRKKAVRQVIEQLTLPRVIDAGGCGARATNAFVYGIKMFDQLGVAEA